MAQTYDRIRVVLAEDGFYPQSFGWQDRGVRVLSVARMRTCGPERRFRVRTVEGHFELAQDIRAGDWRLRQVPSWLDRTLARWAQAPRFSPPAGRRRVRPAAVTPVRAKGAPRAPEGGGYAIGIAVVR